MSLNSRPGKAFIALSALASFLVEGAALAQARPPAGEEGEDLEVGAPPTGGIPAAPAPGPGAPVPPPPVAPAPTAPTTAVPVPPIAAAPVPAEAQRIAELERRLAALEDRLKKSAAEPDAATPPPGDAPPRARDAFTPSVFTQPVPSRFRIGGYVQGDYLHSQASLDEVDQGGGTLNDNRFYLRRARLRVDQGWKYAAVTVELEGNTFRQPTLFVRRAEASLLYRGGAGDQETPLLMVTGGITDIPFGYELYETDRLAPFLERSLVTAALFPTKFDAGLKISGGYKFLRYGVAVMNGEPLDNRSLPRDPNAAKDVIGRFGIVQSVGRAFELAGGASFATGKGFHAGSPARKSTITWRDEDGNQKSTPDELFGQVGSAAEPSQNFDRWAFGVDLAARLRTHLGETTLRGEAIVASNYDRGFLVSDPIGSVDARQFGAYVALTQDLGQYAYVGFRYGVYDPNSDLIESSRGRPEPKRQTVKTLSPVVSLRLPQRARLSFQYDFVRDYLARSTSGVPTDLKNDQWLVRLQVDL